MRASGLRELVTIQSRTEVQGSTGEVKWTWADHKTVRAAIEPVRGEEYFAARQLQSVTTTKIRIRYLADVTTKMRIVHGSRYYEIESVIDVNTLRKEMHLMCKEREADGWRD
jgi:SPP1 family predicted phage head-tail adaptor